MPSAPRWRVIRRIGSIATVCCCFWATPLIAWLRIPVQILGEAGYHGNSRAARLMRDAKFFSIGFGTTEIRKIVAGREL
jgi:alkylation response protein AidB-like acyl-CoA dehydrogenase